MGKLAVGLLAFAAGALVGGLAVGYYVKQHYAGIAADQLGAALGLGPSGTKILGGILNTVDELRA